MSDAADIARLEFVLEIISDMDFILARHKNINSALEDREGHHALMMCCLQIGETLNKVKNEKFCSHLPIELAYGLRNVITHDYMGVSNERIKSTIEQSIPALRETIEHLLDTRN